MKNPSTVAMAAIAAFIVLLLVGGLILGAVQGEPGKYIGRAGESVDSLVGTVDA